MFAKKSNLCCGQNAFLSHYNHSLLKACQEINKTLFVLLPTSLYSIQQIRASQKCNRRWSQRGHAGWGREVSRGACGDVGPSRLASPVPLPPRPSPELTHCYNRFSHEVHIPDKSHPSCQKAAFILPRKRGGVILKSSHGLCRVHVGIEKILIPSSKKILCIWMSALRCMLFLTVFKWCLLYIIYFSPASNPPHTFSEALPK